MEAIKSIKDPRVILARELNSFLGRKKHKKFLIEGEENLKWAIDSLVNINFIICDEKNIEIYSQFKKFIPVFVASQGILKKITETKYLIPIIAVADFPKISDKLGDFIVVLDNIQDYGNLGTIIRTSKAFGINDFLSPDERFDPYYKKTIDSSRGLVYSSNFIYYENNELLVKDIKQRGYQLITTSPEGDSLHSLVEIDNRPIALVIGNETKGVSEYFHKSADKIIQIPMNTNVESLNVGVAAGISIYELKLKQILNMLEAKIKSTLGRKINVLGQLIKKIFDIELKKVTDLGADRVVFLMVLQCEKEMKIEQVIRENGLLESEVNQFLQPLIESKYLQKNGDTISIAPQAEDFLSKIWIIREKAENNIISVLSENESDFFNDILDKLLSRCKDLLTNNP